MSDVPKQVTEFERALLSVPGIAFAEINHCNHSKNNVLFFKEHSYPAEFADLPIAMLNRTLGNLENEVLVFVNFGILRNELGLRGLEFLSWWARDLSRSGRNIQIRSIGLPPSIGNEIQLGTTLRFHFEAYLICESETMEPIFSQLEELTKSLKGNLEYYGNSFKQNSK